MFTHLEPQLFTAFYYQIFSHESILPTSFFLKKENLHYSYHISYLGIGSHIFHGSVEINIECFLISKYI